MSLVKKPRLQFNDHEWDILISLGLFELVGVLTACTAVSKRFLPPNTITTLSFHEQTPLKMIMRIVSRRSGIKSMDFTSSGVVDDSVADVLLSMNPELEFIVFDHCQLLTNFPLPNNTLVHSLIKVNRSGVLKWPNGLCVSLKGCWELFEPYHLQRPANISMIMMNAIYDNTIDSIGKAKTFCINPNDWHRSVPPRIQAQFVHYSKYRIIKEVILNPFAYVLMDVVNYSLVVWIYRATRFNGKKGWQLIVIWNVSIELMWRRLKIYWSTE